MTLSELVKNLKNLIGPAVEVDDDGLKRWINDGYSIVIDEIIKDNRDFFVKSSTTSSVDGQQEYALPTDFDRMVKVEIAYDGTNWKPAQPMGDADLRLIETLQRTDSQQGFTENNPFYYIYSSNLGMMPIPSETQSNNIKIWYVYEPTEMIDDSESPAIPDRFHHILNYWAYANYLDQDDEHVSAERMRRRFDAQVERLVESMRDRQLQEVKSVQVDQNQDLYDFTDTIVVATD